MILSLNVTGQCGDNVVFEAHGDGNVTVIVHDGDEYLLVTISCDELTRAARTVNRFTVEDPTSYFDEEDEEDSLFPDNIDKKEDI